MKVLIGYPPIVSEKGVPLLSQNRQFQWFHKPTYIYPMVPAYAATMAKLAGHDVRWIDSIAGKLSHAQFEAEYLRFAPDVFMFEVKTPVIKSYWKMVRRLKAIHPAGLVALCGDHVTALPEESMEQCPVDYVITGGDYDFVLVELLALLAAGGKPATSALPPGVYHRNNGAIAHNGRYSLDHDLDKLPMIDRDLTQWRLYSVENGNFRYKPGTYTMVGRDCWWGKCSFCSWTTIYDKWRVQSPQKLLDEIGSIIGQYPVREIFDDSGCFPAGNWLKEFCEGVISRGYDKKVTLGCNMIPGVLSQDLYDLMAKANFRFVLFGLESAHQETLDRINKCGKAKDIENSMRMAKQAGLEPHVTCMVGYPWETREQAESTIALARRMFDNGHIDTLQATIVVPYPGTRLFDECRKSGWLLTDDWDRYDMREPVMKTPMTNAEVLELTRGIYKAFLTPRFILRKLLTIRSFSDIAYYWRAGIRVLGHLLDFGNRR